MCYEFIGNANNSNRNYYKCYLFNLEIIFFLIFLEIIELNFCKLNYNLKRKIEERAINEKIYNVNDEDQKIFIDEESKYYIKTELFSEK